jgi:hypothetical protein
VLCQETAPGRLWLAMDDPPPGSQAERPVCLDAWCPQVLPLLTHRLCQHFLASMRPGADDGAEDRERSQRDPQFAATAEKARGLYELALRCARQGNLAEARAHLREAHLANPTCRFGRLAIERLQELEALPPDEEPQSDEEMLQTERAFRQMRATTTPLGLVLPRTY